LVLWFLPWTARKKFSGYQRWPSLAGGWLGVGLAVLGLGLWLQAHKIASLVVERSRNFYGVLTLVETGKEDPRHHHRSLIHGQILHGLQFVDPVGASWPTTYFNQASGVGLAVAALPKTGRRIGVAGLGIGTLAAYSRTNDYFRFYEINPEALRMALSPFTYLSNCRAKTDYKLGDARLSLEKEPPQNFDLLVLDAFAGDSPPVHLLTKEAFELYEKHLKPSGVIAVNISNKYLNLEPVLANVALALHFHFAVIDASPDDPAVAQTSPTGETWWLMPCTWVLLTHDPEFLNTPAIRRAARPPQADPSKVRLWTDDFTSLFQVLR
jgi:hypothetical protein